MRSSLFACPPRGVCWASPWASAASRASKPEGTVGSSEREILRSDSRPGRHPCHGPPHSASHATRPRQTPHDASSAPTLIRVAHYNGGKKRNRRTHQPTTRPLPPRRHVVRYQPATTPFDDTLCAIAHRRARRAYPPHSCGGLVHQVERPLSISNSP